MVFATVDWGMVGVLVSLVTLCLTVATIIWSNGRSTATVTGRIDVMDERLCEHIATDEKVHKEEREERMLLWTRNKELDDRTRAAETDLAAHEQRLKHH